MAWVMSLHQINKRILANNLDIFGCVDEIWQQVMLHRSI